jgi:hypothetical protein
MIASYECDLKQALRMLYVHGGWRNIAIGRMALGQRQATDVSAGNGLYQAAAASQITLHFPASQITLHFPVAAPLQVISAHFQMRQRVQLAEGKAHALNRSVTSNTVDTRVSETIPGASAASENIS